jgi:autotransporter translocation and assembly factor TamB
MKRLNTALHLITALAILLLLPAVLLMTNLGLRASLSIAKIFSPVKFNYRQVDGQIIGLPIVLKGLQVEYNEKTIKVGQLTVDWQLRSFKANDIEGIAKLLPRADSLTDQELVLQQVYGVLKSEGNSLSANLQIQGQSAQATISGSARVFKTTDGWQIENGALNFGRNFISFKQQQALHYSWNIDINDPKVIFANSSGELHAYGNASNLQTAPSIIASFYAKNFVVDEYQIVNLHGVVNITPELSNPLVMNISSDNLKINDHILEKINIKLSGSLEDHALQSKAIYNKQPIYLSAMGSVRDTLWSIRNITISYAQQSLSGTASYNLQQLSGNLDLHGTVYTIPTTLAVNIIKGNNVALQLNMHENQYNNLHAQLQIADKKLNGQIKASAHDIAFLMQWMPDVTRLKGKFDATVNIQGTIDKPIIISEAHVTEITATMPSLGIKIKPMELHLRGDKNGKIVLQGKGFMRRGSGEFTLQGFIEPFKPGLPNELTLTATRVEFVNNQTAHLTASSKLTTHYITDAQRLDVTGDIEIHGGNINFIENQSQTVKTKDVVFVNEVQLKTKKMIIVNPNIFLRLEDGVHFAGFGLDADVTGKVNISHRHDALYADGRITIKQGIYQLPGQKLVINHGRLLYPPGTLLVNPVLDIKMIGKNKGYVKDNNASSDLELIVQGTAQKPIISESGLSSNQDRALSQALLTGTSLISNNLIQDKLKISEIGLTTKNEDHIEFFDDPKDRDSLKNKELVLGRPLGNRLYVQYLHSISEANQKVRLKYSLNKIWSIGVESGTEGGGADLSFTIERD